MLNHNSTRGIANFSCEVVSIHVHAARLDINENRLCADAHDRFRHGDTCECLEYDFVARRYAECLENRRERNTPAKIC